MQPDGANGDSNSFVNYGSSSIIDNSIYEGSINESSSNDSSGPGESRPVDSGRDEGIVVIDFGSQYTHLIARRIRELRVYSEIVPVSATWEQAAQRLRPRGVILSGGPASVYDAGAPVIPRWVFEQELPVLGICYGMQAMVHQLGGQVAPGMVKEYGHASLHLDAIATPLFQGLPDSLEVWMSHADRVEVLPAGFSTLAHTDNSAVAAIGDGFGRFGLQFHPEVAHTPLGMAILENFLRHACGCRQSWTSGNFVAESINRLRDQVGGGRVICALSGGVDSAVTAALLHQAIGDQLSCILVNNGLLREGEAEAVQNTFKKNLGYNLMYVDATDRFLQRLERVTDPEEKRKVIGAEFIRVFEAVAPELSDARYLAQGTLYPDVIESETPENRASARIKSHHNVGGLPEHMELNLVEPLRYLFKDEVREVGLALGLPREMVYRQPFPGPGLAIRIIGEVTRERLAILRGCDTIVLDEVKKAGLYDEIWQSFAVLTDSRSVGVMGDYRTYGYVCAIRAVSSDDAMTADWVRLPYQVLSQISNRIVNEVSGVNRVVYDITSKPPGTIEWE
jgi:GMP synthase (glutamine-hydrolysing)